MNLNIAGESDGIGVMGGRDEDGLLAWTELRINPRLEEGFKEKISSLCIKQCDSINMRLH